MDYEEDAEDEDEKKSQENAVKNRGGKHKRPRKKGGKDTPSPEIRKNIDGLSLHNYFLNRLKDRDPVLFLTKKEGMYKAYSRSCAANINRQPVILTNKEKEEIDKKNPNSYSHAMKYGSTPETEHWYICPRYWCMLTNSSISEEDVKLGKCGKLIPQDAKEIPKGAYVYEFNSQSKEHINPQGEYIEHYPGFFEDSHPKGHCVPCCFKLHQNKTSGEWEMSKEQIKRRDKCLKQNQGEEEEEEGKEEGEEDGEEEGAKEVDQGQRERDQRERDQREIDENGVPKTRFISYIKSAALIPLEQNRWGFLPMSLQLFLKINYQEAVLKTDTSVIKPDIPCLLRYGVEQVSKQSFLGSVAEIYGYKHSTKAPTVKQLRKIMADSITLDLFIKYHNGSLISMFKPKLIELAEIQVDSEEYSQSEFWKSIDLNDETQYDFLVDTIASYKQYKTFLSDETVEIDHTYLWDMMTTPNPMFMKDGVNLVILEIPNNDITENIEIICPTNSSSNYFDQRKETVVLMKQGEFYEPIYVYEERKQVIHELKTFIYKPTALKNVIDLLALVQKTTKNYCSPKPSKPIVYEFEKNISLEELFKIIKTMSYEIDSQIMNYQGKIIGLLVKHETSDIQVFLPCFPSAAMKLPIRYMDEDIWTDYPTTLEQLYRVKRDSKKKILCEPRIKVLEDGLIVGILTETNQFIQVSPPSENIDDELETISGSSYNEADQTITTSKTPDKKRQKAIRNITLESNFYGVFREKIRQLLNLYENAEIRKKIMHILEKSSRLYKQKLGILVELLKRLTNDHIRFQEMGEEILMHFDEITGCSKQCGKNAPKYCLKEGDKCILLIPKKHLISKMNNETIYYGRMADELIRYKRIRQGMFQPNTYMNIGSTEYKINENELFILQTIIGTDEWKHLVAFNTNRYIRNINYDTAEPLVSQTYSNEVSLQEQNTNLPQKEDENTEQIDIPAECIKKRDKVIGNSGSLWKRSFPKNTNELVFMGTTNCSFYPILWIFQEKFKRIFSIQNIKAYLWESYKPFLKTYESKMISILRIQGKKKMMDRVKSKEITMEIAIKSEEYYITDLDLWVLANSSKIPLILFSSTTLKALSLKIDWILLGGDINEKVFFIRSPAQIVDNTAPEYHLIIGSFAILDMKEFQQIVESATSEKQKNIQTLETYLSEAEIIKKGK